MTSDSDNIIKGEVLTFALDNDLTELDQLHAMVDSFGLVHALDKRIIFETNLVLEEVFTNIISYAHEDKDQHQVHFSLSCNKDSVTIRIEDNGSPFNLLEAEPVDLETDLEHRSVGGLGIHLIRKLMDDVKYQRVGAKNVVTIRKNCGRKKG
ncbi:MAG: ATP-binding protein [Desulfobulbaceae bacterium]|nr:ATP-binding protein [Desulfobulbaceae bacterium]